MNISKISKFLLKEKNKVIPVFLRLLGALLVFLLLLSVNRFHAIELYGELAYYQIVVGFLATMILSGLDKIIIASFHNKNIDKTELISNHLIVIAVNFIIVSMVLWVIQFYLNMISIQILIIPIVGLKAVRLYLNEVSRANSQYNFYSFQTFVLESIILIAYFISGQERPVPLGLICSETIVLLLSILYLSNKIKLKRIWSAVRLFNVSIYRSNLFNARNFFLLGISVYFVSWSDQFILKNMMNFTVLGMYAALVRVGQLGNMPLSALQLVWQNEISQAFHDGSTNTFSVYKRQRLISVIVTLISAVIAFLFRDFIFEMLHIDKVDYMVFGLILFGFFVDGSYGPIMGVLMFSGKENFVSKTLFFLIPYSILINLILISLIGIYGAAIAFVVIRLTQNHIFYMKGKKVLS